MNSFSNRVVLITGAASGIGRELARVLSRDGARIAALDRSADGLAALEAELKAAGGRCAAAVADVTETAGMRAAVTRLEAQLGPTDMLIAGAGVGRETSATDFDPEVFAETVRINLAGVANSIAAVLPGMRERRRGHLAALSSLASYRGLPRMAAYCASKAGVNALLDALRVELRTWGIVCTTICPGWVRTPMTAALDLRGMRMLSVEDAGRRIVKALRRRRPFVAFPAGDVWRVRLLRYLPRPAADWLAHQLLKRSIHEP
ncbi:MAG TPA: SDR family NAD(P)-dependent oxidoreductase [Gemmataceae bacterium]|nr:SDR family NAD(P)-dependent oxidoreductase [Gemmataceae bacterium]